MKPCLKFPVAALILGLVAFAGRAALADDCGALGGALNLAGECEINSTVTRAGVFNVSETLHITSTGKIDVASLPIGGLTVNIGGSFVMDAGSLIDGNVAGCGTGLPITLNVTGDVTQVPGAIIRSNSCSGGAILITSKATVDIDGLVESVGSISGTGAIQRPGGGTIDIIASCDLTITDAGIVSSRGKDPGADKVHLEGGCKVKIFGLVESTGVGHGVPNHPVNHCDHATRPDKPTNSTACVEVWAGDSLLLDSTGTHNGEVNADTGGPGGSGGTSWIDLFARGDITLIGDTSGTLFDVHANGLAGTNDNGGVITVKSRDGSVRASGTVLQADATNSGGKGGSVVVQAFQAVNLNDAQIFARGDFAAGGGFGFGGQINAKAFNGTLSWVETGAPPQSIGDVRPTGAGILALPFAQRGTITLQDCTAGVIDTTGTLFPANGTAPPPPTILGDVCGGSLFFQTYVIFPDCVCGTGCVCFSSFTVNGQVMTITGTGLLFVSEVDFNDTCALGGIIVPKAAFSGQTDSTITLPSVGSPGKHVILVGGFASSCSANTAP